MGIRQQKQEKTDVFAKTDSTSNFFSFGGSKQTQGSTARKRSGSSEITPQQYLLADLLRTAFAAVVGAVFLLAVWWFIR